MNFKIIAKTVLALVLIVSVFFIVDFDKLMMVLRKTNPLYYLAAVLAGLLRTFSGIFRLFYLLGRVFDDVHFIRVLRDGLVAGFYNLFLPTTLGGDVPKVFLLNRHLKNKKKIVAAIITERVIGFFSLIVLAFICLFLIKALKINTDNFHGLFWLVSVILGCFLLLFGILGLFSFQKMPLLKFNAFPSISSKIMSFLSVFKDYDTSVIINIFIQSVIYQVIGILVVYLIGLSLGIKVEMLSFFVVVPLIWFVMMIPISISSLGLREGAFIYFFSLFGVANEQSLGLSLLFFFQTIIIGAIGGLVLLIHPGTDQV